MKTYKHLFFDLDNTLYDFNTNAYIAMKEAFLEVGLLEKLSSFDDFFSQYEIINEELWSLYREKNISKDNLRIERFKRSLNIYNITPQIPYTDIDDLYLQIMSTQTNLFPETKEILEELKKRNYKLHIITNGFREVQKDKINNTGLSQFITNVFISEEIKSPKPSREIFEWSVKSSNAKKKESLMIGDSWESDIIGAKKFGIDQVFFNPDRIKIDYQEYDEPTYTIYKLNELLNIL
jgi:putative hydrolase of the HAD superfamily